MPSMYLTVLAVLCWAASVAQAYFYVPNFMSQLPFQGGMASAPRGSDSLILFGGENATSHYSNNLYQLTQTQDTFTWEQLPATNAPNGSTYGQAMVSNTGDTLLIMGGMSESTVNQVIPLQMYSYSFNTHQWNAWQGNTNMNATGVPQNRQLFSATYDNSSTVYIYGGALNNSAVFADFWSLDTKTMTFTQLPTPNIPRYGHTASLTSDGKLVILGGVGLSQSNGQVTSSLASMHSAFIYDTNAKSWSQQALNGDNGQFPSTRNSHSAVITSDDKIVIFGGDSAAPMRQRQYLNAIAILDTKSWTWTIPQVNGITPSRRSYASAMLVQDKYLMVSFGEALNTYYNDINVFSISDSSWLQSFDGNEDSSSSGVSAGLIAGVTIAAVVLVAILLFLLWRFQAYVRWLVTRIHNDIWKPRTGEPVWAETTRIVFQIFLLFIFVVFLVFVIRQAVDSPNVTQRIEEPVAQVDVPDVRFCFDGYPTYADASDARNPGVVCQTDTGYSCTNFVQQLNMSIFTPTFASDLGAVNCFLFRGDSTFKMTSTSGANNGSRLLFTFFGDQSIQYGRVHVSVYPKAMDPNVKVYNLNDNIPVIMSDADVLNWQNAERNDIQATNVYEVQPSTYSALSYDLVDHRYLQSVGWNYVGFAPITNSTPEVESNFRAEAQNPAYTQTHSDLAFMAIYPNSYQNLTDREVKMYTLVNALGFVGGIFGLLIAVQAWMFGYRPRSPWGVVHRWSVGDMKRSLLRGLQHNFKTSESSIPLVHPLHPRFSMQNLGADLGYESEGQRISRVEERMQVLELLFKAYYVDDEIFRSLDNANKNVPPSPTGGGPFFPPTEKVDGFGRTKSGGFSHMFNHRQSVASVSSDSNSQRHLNDRNEQMQLRDI